MSLLTSYEGLRHQIERLVRENEELKKLVRLIRENHELKSAIKTQAGGLGISGFTSGHGETTAGPSQHQGIFLTPPLASANESVLEEVGVMTLAPLADMLNGPQPSPSSGPIVSPMTGPFNTMLPSPGPITQNSALASLLAGPMNSHVASPMAVPTVGTLVSSLGLPSTGPLTPSNQLTGSMPMSPEGTLASSMGISTGPLTPSGQLTGSMPMSPAGTLASSMGISTGPLTPSNPLAGPSAPSLSSPLLTSTAAPPGVSQNLLAPLVGNGVLSEAPRVQLPEPLYGHPSGPHPSAGAGPAATSKVPLSTEHPLLTRDPEPLSVTFVGDPIQTSTPDSTVGKPGSTTAFSYGTSGARTQPGTSQGQAAPGPVPTAPTASPSAPVPVPQAATNYSPERTTHSPSRPSPTPHSPPRNPHSPPRTSSSPTSVNNTRGPRVPETCRKSAPDLERKLAHRKTSKYPDGPRESKQLAWERLVGEVAFQLDRRILSSIFPERVRLYGFTVSNIPEKIIQASLNPSNHKLDEELCQMLTQRYVSIMNRLQSLGYNGRVHPALTEQLVNDFGILRERPELAVSEGGSFTVDFLQRVLVETVHPSMLSDALLLLSCLNQLAHDDGKPMFIW
ncbi:speriolin [Sturnira hondurensis]|uniref:speriolin n=1 Tax=Sturnira hondurensis TaxID=192404 RepID=UPI00187949B6|nr:speriolin [Sturnira hondurensis]